MQVPSQARCETPRMERASHLAHAEMNPHTCSRKKTFLRHTRNCHRRQILHACRRAVHFGKMSSLTRAVTWTAGRILKEKKKMASDANVLHVMYVSA